MSECDPATCVLLALQEYDNKLQTSNSNLQLRLKLLSQ